VPAVSIITPAYNAAAWLPETIDSVRAQTFSDWELVIVDDGSTDGTAAVVERYIDCDPRIRLLRQANAGPSAARNRAMRGSRGDFLAFLDSDDLWASEFLASQMAVFDEHPETDLVTGNAYFLGGPLDGQPKRPLGTDCRVIALEELISNECAVFIMTVFRRRVFDTIGGLDEAQWTSEDYDFWLRAALAGFVFRRNPIPLGRYRHREDSLSRDTARMLRGILHTYAKIRESCPMGSPARRALDAQVSRFESNLLLAEAKAALERRDFADAAGRLRRLQARGGGALVGLTAWLAVHAPRAALLAYRIRHWRNAIRIPI
jgi:glycosyltransferase involved in cell wall biosynthesis